ncbi:MAG: hypothetical protein ACUVRH_07205 [Candidatus Bipolaricaulia bacterium]
MRRYLIGVTLVLGVAVAAAFVGTTLDRAPEPSGLAAISGEVRVIEAKVIGAKSAGAGLIEQAHEVAWRGVTRTVPSGKKWVVVVTPTDQFANSGDARERWRGFTLNLMGVFRQGEQVYHGELPAGSYTNLDLYIYNTMQLFADTSANHAWAKAPVLYLVLEMEAQ